MALLAIKFELARVDVIGFAKHPMRADERLDPAGVGAVRGAAHAGPHGQQQRLIAAGGLANEQAAGIKRGGEGFDACPVIGDCMRCRIAGLKEHKARLAHVAADETAEGRIWI